VAKTFRSIFADNKESYFLLERRQILVPNNDSDKQDIIQSGRAVCFQAEQKLIELNALRYSAEKSKVVIQIIENGNNIEFSVRDYGKGIDEKYQQRLFDRYFQVPTDGNNISGSGLGLAISKDFIQAEGGRIWVKSAMGEGSRFCFSLPAAS
jgi:K+-sensing histidine kinase KdpD